MYVRNASPAVAQVLLLLLLHSSSAAQSHLASQVRQEHFIPAAGKVIDKQPSFALYSGSSSKPLPHSVHSNTAAALQQGLSQHAVHFRLQQEMRGMRGSAQLLVQQQRQQGHWPALGRVIEQPQQQLSAKVWRAIEQLLACLYRAPRALLRHACNGPAIDAASASAGSGNAPLQRSSRLLLSRHLHQKDLPESNQVERVGGGGTADPAAAAAAAATVNPQVQLVGAVGLPVSSRKLPKQGLPSPGDPTGRERVEGSGLFGKQMLILLDFINRVAATTSSLAAEANAFTLAEGERTAERRSDTEVFQADPGRVGALYLAGAAAVDPVETLTIASGNSSAVALGVNGKNNFAAAGRSVSATSAISPDPTLEAGSQALASGLATAGRNAVAVGLGVVFGPVLALFNAGTRDGAGSTNGAVGRAIGEGSVLDNKAASLAVYDKTGGNFTDVTNGLPVVTSKGGSDYKAGGAVTITRATANDLPGNPVDRPQNVRSDMQSFGGTNRYGYTRGLAQGIANTFSTDESSAQVVGGSFGTGVATSQGIARSVTLLQDPDEERLKEKHKGSSSNSAVGSRRSV